MLPLKGINKKKSIEIQKKKNIKTDFSTVLFTDEYDQRACRTEKFCMFTNGSQLYMPVNYQASDAVLGLVYGW